MDMKRFDPRGEAFLRMGRYDRKEENCSLWWSGSGVRTRAACTSLEIEAESTAREHAPWLAVTAEGALIARFPLLRGVHRYPVVSGMDAGFPHEISITRDTQPTFDEDGPVRLLSVYADGELARPRERARLVEFIGDSLTVGEGCLGPVSALEWVMAWMSHQRAFPGITAELLQAEKRAVALSGWGVWRSWDSDETHRLGLVYDRLCAVTPGGDIPYGFQDRMADAVVINLGTNDGNALSQVHEAERPQAEEALIQSAVSLIRQVRARQPRALILWAYGLCGYAVEEYLREAVRLCREGGDEKVDFLRLTDCAGDVGSRQHPSHAAHQAAAREIAGYLEAAWKR